MVSINDLLNAYSYKGQNLAALPGTLNFGAGFTDTKSPQMLAQFAKWAGGPGGPLDAATRGAFLGQLEGESQAELAARNQLGYSLAAQGVSPLQARGAIAERTPGFQSRIAGLRAGAESGFNQGLLSLGQATVNSIREAIDYQRMLKMQRWMFEQQMQAIHRGQDMGMLGSLIGAGASLAGAGILAAGMPAAGGAMAAGAAGAMGAMTASPADAAMMVQPEIAGYGGGQWPSTGSAWGSGTYGSMPPTSMSAFGPPTATSPLNWPNGQVPWYLQTQGGGYEGGYKY